MKATTRTALAAVLATATGVTLAGAQNVGMPLFANPHYGTGVRIHVDAGQPADEVQGTLTDQTTVQGGVSFSLARFGIQALAAANYADVQNCQAQQVSCSQSTVSGALLAGLRISGGGTNPLALAVFGGASTDFSSYEVAQGVDGPKLLSLPVGVSVGYKLGMLRLWAAPRYNFYKFSNCNGNCPPEESDSDFRWSAGVMLPLGPIGIRGAYDAGKIFGVQQEYWGLGISLGLGSQQ